MGVTSLSSQPISTRRLYESGLFSSFNSDINLILDFSKMKTRSEEIPQMSNKPASSISRSFLYGFILLLSTLKIVTALDMPTSNTTNGQILPPCRACKTLVGSFVKGMERTARGKFEGGDANWEETRLRNYAFSEVRLVEIQEKLCSEVPVGKNQCHSLSEAHEALIEKWWFDHQKEHPELQDWLCVQQLSACCPDHHYGPNCKLCPGFTDNKECSGNGKCKGSGTRKGNGQCVCDKGHVGNSCQSCGNGYYTSYKDDTNNLCSPCYQGCKDICTQAGPKGCLACKDGWYMDTERGCQDLDECIDDKTICGVKKFCVNSPGSYSCLDCDKACKTCQADGPDNCIECADGYALNDGVCTGNYHSFKFNYSRSFSSFYIPRVLLDIF